MPKIDKKLRAIPQINPSQNCFSTNDAQLDQKISNNQSLKFAYIRAIKFLTLGKYLPTHQKTTYQERWLKNTQQKID
jgi:hypothetical protein